MPKPSQPPSESNTGPERGLRGGPGRYPSRVFPASTSVRPTGERPGHDDLPAHTPSPHRLAARRSPGEGGRQLPRGTAVTRFNTSVALLVTRAVGSMWCAYALALFDLISLPNAIRGGAAAIVSWVAQTFLQLMLLSVIMVGQNVQAAAADKRSEATFPRRERNPARSGARARPPRPAGRAAHPDRREDRPRARARHRHPAGRPDSGARPGTLKIKHSSCDAVTAVRVLCGERTYISRPAQSWHGRGDADDA